MENSAVSAIVGTRGEWQPFHRQSSRHDIFKEINRVEMSLAKTFRRRVGRNQLQLQAIQVYSTARHHNGSVFQADGIRSNNGSQLSKINREGTTEPTGDDRNTSDSMPPETSQTNEMAESTRPPSGERAAGCFRLKRLRLTGFYGDTSCFLIIFFTFRTRN